MDTFSLVEGSLARALGMSFQLKDIDLSGFRVHYGVCGAGSPVILLHGGTFGWGMWYKTIPELAKTHKVYALDLPGSGRSSSLDHEKSDFEKDLVDIVVAFIAELKLVGEVTLVGHSFSGWIVMRLCQKNPGLIKKIVLIDPTGLSPHASLPDLVLSYAPLAHFLAKGPLSSRRDNSRLVGFLRSAFAQKNVVLSTEFIEYFYAAMGKSHNIPFISELIRRRKRLYLHDVRALCLPETLVIWGEQDTIVPMHANIKSLKELPQVHIEVIPHVGHVPPLESAESVNTLLTRFI